MMNFEHFAPQVAKIPKKTAKQDASIRMHNLIRDNFTITTWLAIGAVLQGSLVLLVRPTYAVAPAFFVLTYRFVKTMLMTFGIIHNTQMDGVIEGKYSVQIPGKNGEMPTEPSEQRVSVILLGARTNHPLGMFAPGFKELGGYFAKMEQQLSKDPQNNGFLGASSWTAAKDRKTNNEVMTALYFRSPEDIHRYAHETLHREAWNWWLQIVESHPHLSIMHELYDSPKKHWENIFINYHLTGIGKTIVPVKVDDKEYTPLAEASRGQLSTHKGRMSAKKGSEYNSPAEDKEILKY